jgi:hypothetical protein
MSAGAKTRALLVVALAVTTLVGWGIYRAVSRPPARPPAPPGPVVAPPSAHRIEVLDLGAAVERLAHQYGDRTDAELSLYHSAAATIDLHVLGHGQMTPLHIHRTSDEATVVVSGAPVVTQVWRGGQATRTLAPGAVVGSPTFCAHEWVNPALDRMQANLVISAPPFDGNLFVKPGDARLGPGAPRVIDPDEALAALRGAHQRVLLLDQLPSLARRLRVVTADESAPIALGAPGSPTIVCVLRGQGALDVDGVTLAPQRLLRLPAGVIAQARARAGAPLALLVFQPEADASDR